MRGLRRRWGAVAAGTRRRAQAVLGLVVGLVAVSLGIRLPAALALVVVLAALAVVAVWFVAPAAEVLWAAPREEPYRRGWQQLSLLAHDIAVADSSPWEFDAVVRPRLRRLAGAALIRLGVDWDAGDAADLLGADVHLALSGGPVGAGGRTALVRSTLDAVTRLDDAGATPTTPTGTATTATTATTRSAS